MSISTPTPTWKRFDTYPPLIGALQSAGLFVDLTSATAIKAILKGTTALVTGSCTKLTVATPTGTLTLGSASITAVSALTNIVVGSSIQGAGVPQGARVGSINSVTNVITMVDVNNNPIGATAAGTGVTLTINVGTVSYTWGGSDLSVADTYQQEFEVTWTGGAIETFPNDSYNTIIVKPDLENA
jgi:hypothetical protein